MKRVFAVIVVALSFAVAAPLAANASVGIAPVAGLWTTTDQGDGSTMYAAIGRGPTPSVFVYDTHIGLCAGPGWLAGSGVLAGNVLVITWGAPTIQCLSGASFGPSGGGQTVWTYDPATDTITTDGAFGNGTDIGDTWHRLSP